MTSSSSSSGSESKEGEVPSKKPAITGSPQGSLWMHKRSSVIHVGKAYTSGGAAIFACGRVATHHHVRANDAASGRRCETCVKLYADQSEDAS